MQAYLFFFFLARLITSYRSEHSKLRDLQQQVVWIWRLLCHCLLWWRRIVLLCVACAWPRGQRLESCRFTVLWQLAGERSCWEFDDCLCWWWCPVWSVTCLIVVCRRFFSPTRHHNATVVSKSLLSTVLNALIDRSNFSGNYVNLGDTQSSTGYFVGGGGGVMLVTPTTEIPQVRVCARACVIALTTLIILNFLARALDAPQGSFKPF